MDIKMEKPLNLQSLKQNISRIKLLQPGTSEAIKNEIENANLDWSNFSYSEYVSNGVYSLSLLSSDGDCNNTLIKDCKPKPTATLKKLPKLEKLLADSGLDLMWARLNLLESGACLWEHKDYSELKPVDRLRIHLPIQTNDMAGLILGGRRIHLQSDAFWKLNPADIVHGAINGGTPRIHLILDCYVNDNLVDMVNHEELKEEWFEKLKVPCKSDFNEKLIDALTLYQNSSKKEAEESLLKTFYHFEQPAGTSLSLVRRMYELLGIKEEVNLWESRKTRFLKQESFENLSNAS